MSEIHWVKLSTAMFDDEKIKAIRSMPSGDSICLIWIQLISLAGRVNDHGQIYLSEDVPYTETTLANSVGHPVGTVRMALQTFKKMGMVELLANDRIALINWEKYQSFDQLEKIRERDRLRKQKSREYLKLLTASVDSPGTCPEKVLPSPSTDSELDSELEEEKKVSTPSGPPLRPRADPKAKPFYNFDDSLWYGITDQQVSLWAEAYPAVDIDLELRQMGEWCKSAGAKGRKQDWRKFIVNWLKRSQDRGGSAPKGESGWKNKRYSR